MISESLLVSQILINPNFSTASHPMIVERIEFSENQTIISLSIENKSETGYFCADKNIYLIDALTSKKYKLTKSKDIPVCPDNHIFKKVGEKLQFQLFFPGIESNIKYINIIEDCKSNCFSIKGIILDKNINSDIDLAYENYELGNLDLALSGFQLIVKNNPDYTFGNLYFNIVQILAEKNDFTNAKAWYKKITNSKFQDKAEITEQFKRFPYYSKLVF
jgi:tetratricopeptide (TPR) repeat protein